MARISLLKNDCFWESSLISSVMNILCIYLNRSDNWSSHLRWEKLWWKCNLSRWLRPKFRSSLRTWGSRVKYIERLRSRQIWLLRRVSPLWTLPIWFQLTHNSTRALDSVRETVLDKFRGQFYFHFILACSIQYWVGFYSSFPALTMAVVIFRICFIYCKRFK